MPGKATGEKSPTNTLSYEAPFEPRLGRAQRSLGCARNYARAFAIPKDSSAVSALKLGPMSWKNAVGYFGCPVA